MATPTPELPPAPSYPQTRRRTPLTMRGAAAFLRRAWDHQTGTALPAELGARLLALVALETGNGVELWDHNWGNIKRTEDTYRVYKDHDEGANDLVRLLLERYPDALAARDAHAFGLELAAGGYWGHEEGPDAHGTALASLEAKYRPLFPSSTGPTVAFLAIGVAAPALAALVGYRTLRRSGYSQGQAGAISAAGFLLASVGAYYSVGRGLGAAPQSS